MSKIKTSLAGFVLFVLVALGSFTTCDIGLGNSVDTKPPKVSIDYPPPTSVIKGSFIIAGKATDETALKNVTVTIRNISNGVDNAPVVSTLPAIIDTAKNSWTVLVPNDRAFNATTGEYDPSAIPDGKYSVAAVATDKANRKTTVEISYFFDNTAPLIKISQPSTTGATNAIGARFGANINFKGDLWDAAFGTDGPCEKIVFDFYDYTSGSKITSFEKQNPGSLLNITVDSTTFDTLTSGMALIPMTEAEKNRSLTYTATAWDYARTYTDPADKVGVAGGNASTHFFLNNDISSLFYNTGVNPKLDVLSNWDNNPAYADAPTVVTRASFIAKRISSTIATTPSFNKNLYANLAVSPHDKSPVIDIAGLDVLEDEDTNAIQSLSNLTIKITPGPDNNGINTGAPGELDHIRIGLTPLLPVGSSTVWTDVSPAAVDILGTSVIVTYKVEETTGKFQLEVQATDKSTPSQTAVNSIWKFSINAGAPILDSVTPVNILSPNNPVKIRPSGSDFAVTVIAKDDQPLTLTTVYSLGGAVPGSEVMTMTPGTTGQRDTYTWIKNIPAPLEGASVTVLFTVNDPKFPSNTITRTFTTDNTGPDLAYGKVAATVLNLSVLPAENRTAPSYESIVEITGYADADLRKAKVHYTTNLSAPLDASPLWTTVDAAANPVTPPLETGLIGTYGKFIARLPLDTLEGIYYVWYALADDALDSDGLPVFGTPTLLCKVVFDSTPPEFYPSYLSTTTPPGTDEVEISGTNLNKGSPYTIRGSVSDANGIAFVTATKKDGITFIPVSFSLTLVPTLIADASAVSRTWTFDETVLTNTTNTYLITATDTAGKTRTISHVVTYDTTGPTLNVINLTNGDFIGTATYTITGTASDTSGVAEDGVEFTINGGTDWLPVTNQGISWNHPLSGLTEGAGKTIQFRVTDTVGNVTTSGVINFGVDTLPPLLTITNKATYNNTSQNVSFTLNGTTSDANGISQLEISLDAGNSYNPIATSVVPALPITSNGVVTWSQLVTIAANGADDGIKTIRIRSTDQYSKQTVDTVTVRFDSAPPTVNVNNLANGQLITATSFGVTGSWSDNGGSGTTSGLAKMQYQIPSGSMTDFAPAAGATSWTQTLTLVQGLNQTISFQGLDALGNTSTPVSIIGVNVDTALPATTVSHGVNSDFVTGYSLVWTPPLYKSATFNMVGTATDTLGVASVVISASPAVGAGIGLTTVNGVSGDTSRTWSVPITPTIDGTYAYTATVTDTAGRITTESRSIIWDTLAPTITGITAPASNGLVLSGTSYTFRGTAADAGSGVKTVRYSFDNATWTDAAGTDSWSAPVDMTTIGAEGPKTLYVQVEDNAGRISASGIYTRTFVYDTAIPTLTVTGALTRNVNSGFSLAGTAADNYGIASVSITQNGIPVTGLTGTTGWNLASLPRNPASIGTQLVADGTFVYLITATDLAAKDSLVTTVTVTVDQTAPNVNTITAPLAGQTGLNSLSGSSYIFRGTIADAGVGPAKIWYVIDTTATAPTIATTPIAAGYTEVLSSGNWSFMKLIPSDLPEGLSYYIHVLAEDSSGNRTATASAANVLFDVDQANPTATETSIGTTAVTNTKVGFSLIGTADDSHGISSITVTQKKDGGSTLAVSTNPPSLGGTALNRTWTLANLPRNIASIGVQSLTDGLYEYVITVTDLAGKTTTINRTVRYDNTGPTLGVTAPASAEMVGVSTKTFQGSVTDGAGSGVASVFYSMDSTDGSNGTWSAATVTGSTWSATAVALGSEGAKTLFVRATDNLAIVTTSAIINYYYDSAPPTLAETTIGTTVQQLTNASVTLAGTASDANALTSVVITGTQDGTDMGILHTDAASPASWTYTTTNTVGNNGLWVYTITATDAASRTTSVVRTVRIDSVAPVAAITLPSAASYISGTSYTATGSVTESNTLASVEYSTNSTDGIDGTWSNASGLNSWTVSLTLATLGEGDKTLWIRASDNAGNTSTAISRSFRVDTNAPGLTETFVGAGSAYRNSAFSLSGVITDNVDLASLSVTENVNAGGAVTVYSTTYAGASDFASAWTVPSMPSGGAVTGQYEYIITVTDTSGKTTSLTRTVTVDVTLPSLEITSVLPILSGANVNGRVTLSVNASDSNGLTGVKYFLRSDASTPVYTDAISAPTSALMSAPYSAMIDTTLLSNSTTYTLWVIARDRAGNDQTVSTTITVNQGSDTPSGTIDSPANLDPLSADRRIRGTFSDDDGVASGGAVLYIRKGTSGGFTSKPISTASSAGQLVSWNVDVTSDMTSGGDGTYQVYLGIGDNAANKLGLGSVTYTGAVQTFVYDVTAPTVSTPAAAPVQGAYKIGDVVTFSWTASDASGIGSQVVDIDGVSTGLGAVTNPSGSNYQIVYTVPASGMVSGNKTLTLVTADTTGRASTRTATILIDVDVPVVENAFTVNPAFVGFIPNGAFELKGTASDNRGLGSVEVALSSDNVTYGSYTAASLTSGNWTFAIADSSVLIPTSGTLYFHVRATDQAGNVSAVRNFSQAVDQASDLALVNLLSPVDTSTYGTTVQISGTAADDDNLAGVSPISANAIEIEYRGTAPVVAPVTVNPTIIGTGKNANFNYTLSGLATGTYAVRSRARDSNGIWGSWTSDVSFVVNAGAPNLVISTVVGTFRSNASLTLTGTVADAQGVKYVQVLVNGTGLTVATPGTLPWGVSNVSDTWSVTIGLGSDGLKTIEVQTADMGDLVTTQQITTTLDSTAPAGTFDVQFRDNPSGAFLDTNLLNKVVRITGTVTELNLRDTNPVEISLDGGLTFNPVNSGTFVWSHPWNTTALSDGAYNLVLRVTDKAGNVTSTITKTVNTLQSADIPVITQTFATAATTGTAQNNILGALLKVSGTISDDDGFLAAAVNLYLDGSASPIAATNTTGTAGTWQYTWASLAEGVHYYSIEATDRNGQVAILGPTYFIVDVFNPTLTVTTPTSGIRVMAGTLNIVGNAVDSGGLGASPLTITLRHSNGAASPLHNVSYTPVLDGGGNFTQPVTINTASLDGTLYIDLVLTDRATKITSITRTVTIDTTSPELNLVYPSSAAYLNGQVSFTGTADDLNGLASVTLQLLNPVTQLPAASITRSGTTLASWEFPFNAFGYATPTYGHDVNSDGKLWKVMFRLTATDNSGNLTELFSTESRNSISLSGANRPSGTSFIDSTLIGNTSIAIGKPIIVNTIDRGTVTAWNSATGRVDWSGSSIAVGTAVTDYAIAIWPFFYIDTDGDKPTISVTQPKNGDNIGGIVSMFGSSTDDDGPVMQVEVRVDLNNDGAFTGNSDVNNNGSVQFGSDTAIFGYPVRIGNAAQKWEDESAWYVVPVTNNAWSQELNVLGELYAGNINARVGTIINATGNITIQVRSRDMFGLPSEISTRTITLDETFPRIENVTPNDQTYQSGTFNFAADYGDNINLNLASNSLVRVNINKTGYVTLVAGANSGPGWSGTLTAALGSPQFGYDLALSIDSTHFFAGSSGIFYVDLYVKDESMYTNQRSFTYYIDNQTPTSAWSDRAGAPDGLNLRNGQVRINNLPALDYAFVEGNYLDSGTVSGTDRVEVYFVKSGQVRRIKGASGSQSPITTESVPVDSYTEGTGLWSTANETLPFVRNSDGGYGDNYVIKIDRATEMSSITTGADSDGDGFFEFLGLDGGSQRFRAYFDSQYLPDGAIDIHYIVYDLAGNRVHKVRRGFIANNGPAYDRIRVGSDYNNNGTVADVASSVTEVLDYYYPTNTIDRLASSSPVNIKNGRLYFAVDSHDPNGTIASTTINVVAPSPGTRGLLTSFGGASGGSVATVPAAPINIVIGSGQFPSAGNYTLEVVVQDNDGITSRRNIVINVLDTADGTAPVVAPIALTQANGIPMSGPNKLGHIELQADNTVPKWATISGSYGSDNDPKVSGEINLKGTITDNNLITALDITGQNIGPNLNIANWSGTQLVSADARLTIDSQALSESGHTVTFTYRWNTAVVTSVAGLNKTIAFRATDGNTNNSAAHATLQYDVVPYVTGMTTALSSAFPSNPSVIQRAASGAYSIRESESMIATGFNFGGVGSTVSLSGTPIVPSAGSATSLTLPVGTTAVSGAMTVTVNSQISINNLDDNLLIYNQTPNGLNNLLLTNDLIFSIWRFTSVVTNATIRYPSMRVSTSAAQEVGFIYDSGAQYVRMNVANVDYQIDMSYTQWYDTAFALDSNGRPYGSSMNGDSGGSGTQSNGTYANFEFYSWNTTAAPGTNNNTNTSAYSNGTKKVALENSYNNAVPVFDSNRIQSPKIATYVNGATTNVYMSYYDRTTNTLKYRWGTVTGTYPTPTFGGNLLNHGNVSPGSGTGFHTVAGTASVHPVGQYSAVGVNSTGTVAFMTWYDATNQCLVFSYNTSPGTASGAQWQTNATVIDSDFSGWYVDMVVDDLNGIHIAYYNSSNGDLNYVYLPTYLSAPQLAKVDSFLGVGTNVSIAVQNNGGNRTPYISYFMGAFTSTRYSVRTAWRTNFSGVAPNGVVNDQYTGAWEVMTIPTANNPKDYTVGIGLKNNGTGTNTPILGYATNLGLQTAQLK